MPQDAHSRSDSASRPLVVGHRGASADARENTIEAFELARRLGAHMVELDVRRCATGELVVHHDPAVEGRVIATLALVDVPSFVPGLNTALDACGGMEVNIEIKNEESEPDFDGERTIADDVVALLGVRGDGDRMLISSFDRATIEKVRRLDSSLRTGFLFVAPELGSDRYPDLDAFMRGVAADGHVAVHPHRYAATKELCDAAHAHGLQVNVWTVDKPEEIRMLTENGVDAIITNRIASTKETLDSLR